MRFHQDEEIIDYVEKREQSMAENIAAKKKAVKKTLIGFGIGVAAVSAALVAWSFVNTVPAGYVGVRVNLYADKGVQNEVLGTGRYFVGINQQLFRFPTFNQLENYKQPFVFQSSDAMEIKARVGVEYNINPEKVATIFTTYRKGIDDITQINLRQYISDGLIKHAVKMDINELTQGGKSKLLDDVTQEIKMKLEPVGIRIIKLSWTDDLTYPEQVRQSINAKIEATQRALLRENEVAQSKAEAEKLRVAAQGEADARITKAKAEAELNSDITIVDDLPGTNAGYGFSDATTAPQATATPVPEATLPPTNP